MNLLNERGVMISNDSPAKYIASIDQIRKNLYHQEKLYKRDDLWLEVERESICPVNMEI